MQTMTTSFVVRPVDSHEALEHACLVRAVCYGHHVPTLRDSYAESDLLDEDGRCTSFIALDKATGLPLGTLRVQVGHRDRPLWLEASYDLPPHLVAQTRAELTRMSVVPKADPLVRPLLWKAGLYFCLANQVQCMVIGARRPSLIRQYASLGFTPLTEQPVTFGHAGGLPHHVLHFDIRTLERRWFEQGHPMYGFMFGTHHPDLDVIGPRWRPARRVSAADQPRTEIDSAWAGEMPPPSQRVRIA